MKPTKILKQTGSLMIEMVAVIGLLALITPILFQQIQRRNEEIVNAQIATEMRMLKDALTAYIQADEKNIAKDCSLWDDVNEKYKDILPERPLYCGHMENLSDYLVGNSGGIMEEDYEITIHGYTVPTYYGSSSVPEEFRPVIFGIIAQKADANMGTLRRAAKVAALIGLEGGVVQNCTNDTCSITGMSGAWVLTVPKGDVGDNSIAAITSFDNVSGSAILKDVEWQHLKSETAQADTMAAKRLGVQEILTVDSTENCIADYGNNTVQVNGSDTCAPFFEVNPTTKEVKLAGVIKTDKTTGATCSATDEANCEKAAGCVWIATDDLNNVNGGECVSEYVLNPTGTSQVEDIKINARGGAKLSEILPNWILKETKYFAASSASSDSATLKVDIPDCPAGYQPAITTIPTLSAPSPLTTTYPDTDQITGVTAVKVLISSSNTETTKTENEGASGQWDIHPKKYRTIGDSSSWNDAATTVSVLVHTYCVYTAAAGS